MPNNAKHFAVNADDVERARKFYEATFRALQARGEIVEGKPISEFECTIGVNPSTRQSLRWKPTEARQ